MPTKTKPVQPEPTPVRLTEYDAVARVVNRRNN